MTKTLKHEEWKQGKCHYFVEQYMEKFATTPLWRYGEYTSYGKVVQASGLMSKPSKNLNYFQLS